MNRRSFSLLLLALAPAPFGTTEAGEFDVTPYQYHREISGVAERGGLGVLELDAEVYRHGGEGYAKLQLVKRTPEGGLVALPWIVEPVAPPSPAQGEQHIPHRIESFEEKGDGSIEVTVLLEEKSPSPATLEILTPLRDFEKGVTVSVVGGGSDWSDLVSDALIFDFQRFLDFRRTRLALPQSESRRIRVRISDATDQQRSEVRELSRTFGDATGTTIQETATVRTRVFRIDEIRFFTASKKEESGRGRADYELSILERKESKADQRSEILLDGGGLPLSELRLETTDRNFRRNVSLQVPDPASDREWRTVFRGSVHRYEVGDFRDERLALPFPEQRSDRYRLLVENLDSPPLAIDSVAASGGTYELLFLPEPGDGEEIEYALYLGSPSDSMKRPRLDTAAVVAANNRKVPGDRFSLGEPEENAAYRRSLVSGRMWFDSPAVLWSAIALVVALLIVVLYRTLQRVEAEVSEE